MPIILTLFFGIVFRDFRHLLRDLIETVRAFCRFYRWFRMGDRMPESERFDSYEAVFRDVHQLSPSKAREAAVECVRREVSPREFRKWFLRKSTRITVNDKHIFLTINRVFWSKRSKFTYIFKALNSAQLSRAYDDQAMREAMRFIDAGVVDGFLTKMEAYNLRMLASCKHIWTEDDIVYAVIQRLRSNTTDTLGVIVSTVVPVAVGRLYLDFEDGTLSLSPYHWNLIRYVCLPVGTQRIGELSKYISRQPDHFVPMGKPGEEYFGSSDLTDQYLKSVGGLNIVDATAGVTSPVVMAPQMSEEKARRLADMFIRELQKRK